jgi:hypothetical protein
LLAIGRAQIVVALAANGSLRIATPDRTRGAEFVDALARWLGTPLADLHCATTDPPDDIVGSHVDLGGYRSDGIEWQVHRLTVGDADLFLRLAPDAGRATLVEKSPRHRTALIRIATRALGQNRFPARRRVVTTQDRRARFTVPTTWRVSTTATGATRVDNPGELGFLVVYTHPMPRRARGLPPLADRLRVLFDHPEAFVDISQRDRGDVELVLATDATTVPGGRGEWALAANDHAQAVVTYYYRADVTGRAVDEWSRIIDSLDLALGPSISLAS